MGLRGNLDESFEFSVSESDCLAAMFWSHRLIRPLPVIESSLPASMGSKEEIEATSWSYEPAFQFIQLTSHLVDDHLCTALDDRL